MKAIFRSTSGYLIPVGEDGVELCRKNAGDDVLVEVRKPRNLAHLKKFFALRDFLWSRTQCGDIYPSKEALRKAITMSVGYFEVIPTARGPREIPTSIAIEAMDQADFDVFYDACIKVILEKILPHLSEAELQEELMEFVT